jgi:FkbM family methyltransferase
MLLDFNSLKQKHNMDIKGVIHIGGHHGQEFKTYVENNISNVMFFEPVPTTFKILKENIGDKAILHNVALGNENKKIEMYIETANQGQSSSILEPGIHTRQYPHITFDNKLEVDMVRLDDFIEESTTYNFINIDVQGYELEVMKGAINTLKNVDYIMSEVNRDEVYINCSKVDELDSFLSNFGFNRVETTWDGLTWGDALYVKG